MMYFNLGRGLATETLDDAMTAASQLAYTMQSGQKVQVVVQFTYRDEIWQAGYETGGKGYWAKSGSVEYTRVNEPGEGLVWGRIVRPGL